jgi:hypothetical protein
MKAEISYEVRSRHVEGEGYGGTYTERTLWRVTIIGGKKMKDETFVATFNSNSEADIFMEWLKEHAK